MSRKEGKKLTRAQRRIRLYQVFFVTISVLVLLSMILSLVINS
jgi:predicted nucleic acid-binding Zn ribbon protein